MEEIITSIQDFIQAHYFLDFIFVIVFTKLIEISPVKVYPLTWIHNQIVRGIKWVINEANKEKDDKLCQEIKKINTEISSIKSDLNDYHNEQKRDKIKTLRKEILDFSDDLYANHEHQIKNYERILFDSYPEYEKLLESIGETNGQVDSAIEYIEEKYHQHLDKHDFIL